MRIVRVGPLPLVIVIGLVVAIVLTAFGCLLAG